MRFKSDAKFMGRNVSDEFIVESLHGIPTQTLHYAFDRDSERDGNRFVMKGHYNGRYYDLSFFPDELDNDLKIRLFNYEANIYNYFKRKNYPLLDYILSTDIIEYAHQIPMLHENDDIDLVKSVISWITRTERNSEFATRAIGESYGHFDHCSKEERVEIKRHFWDAAINSHGERSFHCFPRNDGAINMLVMTNTFPLFDRYNMFFGIGRIGSKDWTDEDIDVMIEFVKKHEVSPYFIAHDTRSRDFNGMCAVYKASLESGNNYLKFKDVDSSKTYITWKIPRQIFDDREVSNFINKMKLVHGVD